ncbi:o-succinylbenzoate synthase [Parabacteroides sp. ZJ-118]|uniref:o-succinylbenzoate synthase n=1 Tax=Parabacteroides sp. ZJ-118 TaxID=2709398 RepID=UPI0013ECB139|nr:o-succinylbenzoate synthase [Parabacteroides sp. ZJ-118]
MITERFHKVEIIPRCLTFKRPAGTSRGVYTTRRSWEVRVRAAGGPPAPGIGECAPLPDLSRDYGADYETALSRACLDLQRKGYVDTESLRRYPSILFGLETAARHCERRGWRHYDTPFSRGQAGIPINGLIWMGDYAYMLRQVEEKLREGFRCVKLKIGAIDFERELSLLRHIRAHFSAREITLRVDANGAFTPSEAMEKLERLAEMDLHSIEQPIRAGQWDEMARLAATSPLPIALDEELIGSDTPDEKRRLLQTIHPQYLVLKPSLHGGIAGCTEWIRLAETLLGSSPEQPRWWITSALESQIGLNAIAQWCATLGNPLPQGLGTGEIFRDDRHRLIRREGDTIWFTDNEP